MPDLPDYAQALDAALDGLPASLPVRTRTLRNSLAARLARPILADRDTPPFDRAAMDGYALRSESARGGARLRVVGEAAAGADFRRIVGLGEAVKISTGAPLPPGADCVIPHEKTDRAEPEVQIHTDAAKGHCVHPQGADARRGDAVLPAGTTLAPHHLAICAMVGAIEGAVEGGPAQVHVLSSGDELVDAGTPTPALRPEQIRDSAIPLLSLAVPAMGGALIAARRVPDDENHTHAAVLHAIQEADALVTVGGVSVGERDFFPRAFARAGVRTLVKGAAIQPGRPIFVGVGDDPRCAVVALPGNPVSALVTAHLFLWPILLHMAGLSPALPWREVELLEPVRPNPRRHAFRPCVEVEPGRIVVPDWQGSGDLVHTAPTHGVADLPMQQDELPAGAIVRFLPWAWDREVAGAHGGPGRRTDLGGPGLRTDPGGPGLQTGALRVHTEEPDP